MREKIESMVYSVDFVGDEHVIFSMIDFNNYGDVGYMWRVEAYNVRYNRDGDALSHLFDYTIIRPHMSRWKHGVTDFDAAKLEMYETVEEIEKILLAMQRREKV